MPKAQANEIELFAAALLRSVEEMRRGEYAMVHTPEKIAGRKAEALGTSESGYRWVKLKKHCEATGDTPNAVHARRRKRIWTDGVECRLGSDGNLYINPEAYNRWIEGGTLGVPTDRRLRGRWSLEEPEARRAGAGELPTWCWWLTCQLQIDRSIGLDRIGPRRSRK